MRVLTTLIPPLLLIFLVLGTIFLGIATPTEGGAMGATGALIMAILRKRLDWKLLKQAMDSTAKLTTFVVFILIGARVFSLTFYGVDGHRWVEHLLGNLPGGQLGFLIVVNLLIFVLAFFLDFFELAFIIVPLLAPVADKLGIQRSTTLDNPYNSVSTDDFEFIRSWCTATNDVSADQVPCTDQTWVQLVGAVPDDSAAWAQQRVSSGRDLFAEAGLPTPVLFETPHYSASKASYQGISAVYPTRYERELLYAGTLTATPATATQYIGMFYPYAVNDPYGAHVLPENLGNYAPDEYNQHAIRTAQDIVGNARANLVVTQSTASFFFHPYYSVDVLKEIVEGIQGLGYTFVPATQLQ